MKSSISLLGLMILFLLGCNSEPTLQTVTGKVTLGGKPYERLIVYLHPIDATVTRHNMGIGETDASGMMKLVTSAGEGIATGKYRISFSCYQAPGGAAFNSRTEKLSEVGGRKEGSGKEPVNLVPAPYNSSTESPVEFTVEAGVNTFDFDVPLK